MWHLSLEFIIKTLKSNLFDGKLQRELFYSLKVQNKKWSPVFINYIFDHI